MDYATVVDGGCAGFDTEAEQHIAEGAGGFGVFEGAGYPDAGGGVADRDGDWEIHEYPANGGPAISLWHEHYSRFYKYSEWAD